MSDDLFSEISVTRTRPRVSNLLKYATDSRNKGFFNDVTVTVDGLSIPASRMILACHSRFFERMFKTNTKEKYEPVVEIQGGNGPAVAAIIDYFYSESIDINSDVVMSLLAAADHLQIDDVIKFCCEYLKSIVSPRNAITILNAAKSFQIVDLTEKMYQFIGENLKNIALTIDFKNLSKQQFLSCVTGESKKHAKESFKYQALILWVKHDQESREKEFKVLFQDTIDLTQVSVEFIETVLLKEHLVRDYSVCYEKVLSAFSRALKDIRL